MRAKLWFGALLCSVAAAGAAQEPSAKAVPAPEQVALAARIDALAAKLARSPVAATGNLCFCPLSVAATLASLQPGVKQPVRAAIDRALLADGQDLVGAVACLRALSADIGARQHVEWRQRQLVWFDGDRQFDPQWLAELRRLGVPCEAFVPGDGFDALLQRMRVAVADAVGEQAAATLQGAFALDTRMVLVDALCLSAAWKEAFTGRNDTGVGEFAVSPQQRIPVTYLKRAGRLHYGKVGDDQVVRLELAASGLVVDFALPPAGGDASALPAALQNLLEGDWGAATPRLQRQKLELAVPSFEIRRTLTLQEVSVGSGCGVPALRVAADTEPDIEIRGDLTTHFALGAEGIGATSVSEVYAWGPGTAEPRVVHLTFDRPFAFAARDTISGLVLVCGIVREPPAMRSEEPEERDR